jgi:hypothetical protein
MIAQDLNRRVPDRDELKRKLNKMIAQLNCMVPSPQRV